MRDDIRCVLSMRCKNCREDYKRLLHPTADDGARDDILFYVELASVSKAKLQDGSQLKYGK